MGLFKKLSDALADHSGELGELPVPGELTRNLPPGKVKLTYRIHTWVATTAGSGSKTVDVPKSLQVTVTPAGSDVPLAHQGSQQGASSCSNQQEGWSQRGFGHVEVPAEGEYRIEAQPLPAAAMNEQPGFPHREPMVLLGP